MSDYLFGLHAVQAALEQAPDSVSELWVDQRRHDKRMAVILELAKKAGTTIHGSDKHELETLVSGARHQGVVARSVAPRNLGEADLDRILDALDAPPFLLILDGVTDPHNLGACLRSADAAGVQAVIAPKDRAASLTATAVKVASGAAQTVPFVQVTAGPAPPHQGTLRFPRYHPHGWHGGKPQCLCCHRGLPVRGLTPTQGGVL